MKRLLVLAIMLYLTVATSWAVTAHFTPTGPGGASTLAAAWDPSTHLFTLQGYYGQGVAPASFVVEGLPVAQDIQAFFSLSATLQMDGSVDPGGTASLYGFSESAGLPTPIPLLSGILTGGAVDPAGGAWSLPCTVATLAEPFNGQAGNPTTCQVAFRAPEGWNWDPFHVSGEPVITFESTPNPVPEPGTWVLMLTGMAALAYTALKRARKDHA